MPLGWLVLSALDHAIECLIEALGDEVRVPVWRLAASYTGRLLVVLGRGAAAMGRPLPPEVAGAALALEAWSHGAHGEPRALEPPMAGAEPGGRVRVVGVGG